MHFLDWLNFCTWKTIKLFINFDVLEQQEKHDDSFYVFVKYITQFLQYSF